MRKTESSENTFNSTDQESSNATMDTSMSGLEIDTNSQQVTSQKKSKFQNPIFIGVLAVFAVMLVMIGVLKFDSKDTQLDELSLIDQEAQPTMLAEEEECSDRQIVLSNGSC